MFNSIVKVTKTTVGSKWNMSNVTYSTEMFNGCNKLPNFSTDAIDVSKAYVLSR